MNQNIAVFKIGAFLLAAGLGLGRLMLSPARTPAAARPSLAARADQPLKVGMPAPDFRAQDLDGKWFELAPLIRRGAPGAHEMVLLAFFSVSPEQGASLRNLNGLAAAFGAQSGFHVVAVSADDPAKVRDFARRNKLAYPVLLDPDLRVHKTYEIRPGASAYVLIGGNGALFAHPRVL